MSICIRFINLHVTDEDVGARYDLNDSNSRGGRLIEECQSDLTSVNRSHHYNLRHTTNCHELRGTKTPFLLLLLEITEMASIHDNL